MITESEFKVSFPQEYVNGWVRQTGIEDGAVLEHQTITINDVEFDKNTEYFIFKGSIKTKVDG